MRHAGWPTCAAARLRLCTLPTCSRNSLWNRLKILALGWWIVHRIVHCRVSASSRSRVHRLSAVAAAEQQGEEAEVTEWDQRCGICRLACVAGCRLLLELQHRRRLVSDYSLLSKPLLGSSKNSSMGRVSSSMATHSRFLSPPLIPLRSGLPTRVCLRCPNLGAGSQHGDRDRHASEARAPHANAACSTAPRTCSAAALWHQSLPRFAPPAPLRLCWAGGAAAAKAVLACRSVGVDANNLACDCACHSKALSASYALLQCKAKSPPPCDVH